jgi:enolase-phosphatase E1
MLHFSGRGILLDIEGTTSSISFVYDVMFPFVRRELEAYLRANWGSPELAEACELISQDAGHRAFAAWLGNHDSETQLAAVRDEALRWMDTDAKTTGLKRLQGMIWESGFASGELQAHVYDDVPPALRSWKAAGLDVRIYSSGSVQAQKLFFGHTIYGNLLHLLQGHYDTTIGPKREPASYLAIAEDMHLPPQEILFLSDVTAELDAARRAGLQTALVRRPGNPAPPPNHGHAEIVDFGAIVFS